MRLSPRAWRRRETYRPERGTPQVWLLAILADRARQHIRRRGRSNPAVGFRDVPQDGHDVDLEAAIARLARRQRLAIELHHFADLRVCDVAAIMGCSEGTVKSTLSDARERLRSHLGEK